MFLGDTWSVLNNFSEINSGITFYSGNKIRTMNSSVYAEATISDSLPIEFSIPHFSLFRQDCYQSDIDYVTNRLDYATMFITNEAVGVKNSQAVLETIKNNLFRMYPLDENVIFPELEYEPIECVVIKNKTGQVVHRVCESERIVTHPNNKDLFVSEDIDLIIMDGEIEVFLQFLKKFYGGFLFITSEGFRVQDREYKPTCTLRIQESIPCKNEYILPLVIFRSLMRLDYDVSICESSKVIRFTSRNKKFQPTYYFTFRTH